MLFDNNSTTSTAFDTATPTVTFTLSGAGQRATFYTLTNGSTGGAPSAWRLEGSKDGRGWTVLDQRTSQAFRWATQTRPFKVATPGTYTTYRLVVTASDGTPRLSEVEFLTDGTKAENAGLRVTAGDGLEGVEDMPLSGTVATFSGEAKSTTADYTATVAWGDGTSSAGTIRGR